jgi:hypothetical protein
VQGGPLELEDATPASGGGSDDDPWELDPAVPASSGGVELGQERLLEAWEEDSHEEEEERDEEDSHEEEEVSASDEEDASADELVACELGAGALVGPVSLEDSPDVTSPPDAETEDDDATDHEEEEPGGVPEDEPVVGGAGTHPAPTTTHATHATQRGKDPVMAHPRRGRGPAAAPP